MGGEFAIHIVKMALISFATAGLPLWSGGQGRCADFGEIALLNVVLYDKPQFRRDDDAN
jgi:hypothetical protein